MRQFWHQFWQPAEPLKKPIRFFKLVLTWFCVLCGGFTVRPSPAFANGIFGPPVDPAALCQAAISFAEQTEALPSGMLHAIGTVESGRPDAATGQVEPWPWTVDANGTGHVYATEQDAIAAAQAFQNAGVTSLDIGCLQVNLQQHPHAFANLAHAFAPAENAFYAARFIRQLKGKLGSWSAAIAAYHSQTPALGLPYEQHVLAVWQSTGGPKIALGAMPIGAGAAFAGVASAIPVPGPKQAAHAAKTPQPAQPPPNHPPTLFAAGGFQFFSMRNQPPVQVIALPHGAPGTNPAGGTPLRGLAAYRAAPIPVATIQ